MSGIVRIASWKGEPRASVVFVHGLGGHVYRTWRRGADDATFWPLWLAQDVEGLAVYSLAYEAPASNWLGTAMPLQDRAVNILEVLLTEPGLRSGPVIFICHSLGGLIVKKMLLNLQAQAARRREAGDLLERVTHIVFAATPHTGSAQATWLDRLRFLAWPTSVASSLVANDPALRDINVTYRGMADDRKGLLRHCIFYETRGTSAGMIVDEASADPGLPGDPPVPIDADHVGIVKPRDRSSLLYQRVRQAIELIPPGAKHRRGLEMSKLPVVRSDQPRNVVPKLIRLAALGAVALIAFRGVQALLVPPLDVRTIQSPLVDQLAEKDRQIAKLLAVLDSQRSTPAPPGADQQLKKAVIAIDDGAKTDSRYAQALDLLKAGKPSEAEPLLKAVAEDKARSAENSARDAAADYRNLASVAAVSDPARAREYFGQAARLDPSNLEGVYWNGAYQLEAGHLEAARAAFERVVGAGGSSDRHLMIWAKHGLGDILIERGDLPGALRSYRDGLSIAQASAGSDSANLDAQRDLSASFDRVGEVQVAQGDLPGALGSYGDGLSIAKKLAQADPANGNWQRDLTVFLDRIGDVQLAQGDLPGALTSYRDGFAIADKLTKSDPGHAGWQRDLSQSFQRIGDVQVAQGDLAGALKSYRDNFAIADRLAQSDPGNADRQRDLTLPLERIGDVQLAQGDLAGAFKSYGGSLSIADRLARSDPGNAGWQHDLTVPLQKTGDVQLAQGDLAGALKSYGDGLAIADRLARSDPSNADWQRDRTVSLERIGDVRLAQGDLPGALKSYRDGLSIRDDLSKASPGNAGWRRDLAVLLSKIGDVEVAEGDLARALKSYSDSLSVRDKLAKLDPGNSGWQRDVSASLSRIGNVRVAQGDLAGALGSYKDGLSIADRLAKSDPGNAGWQRDLSVSLNKVGDVQMAQGDVPGAIKTYGDGFRIRDRLAKSDPGNPGGQQDLSVSLEKLAAALRNTDKAKALDLLRQGRDVIFHLTERAPENAIWKRDLDRFDTQIDELTH
jgi:tetratricopeptide (TPR) repeat protein